MRSPIRNYLCITKKEWNGLLVPVALIVLILVSPYVINSGAKILQLIPKSSTMPLDVLGKAKKSPADDRHLIAPAFAKETAPGVTIELNCADLATLAGVRDIGPSFDKCIARCRACIGRFYRKEQLRQLFGLHSGTYAGQPGGVKLDPALVNKLPVNSVTFEQLDIFMFVGRSMPPLTSAKGMALWHPSFI